MNEEYQVSAEEDSSRQVEALAMKLFEDVLGPQGQVLGLKDEDIVAPDLAGLIRDPENVVATVSDGEKVTGFSVAVPIGKFNPERASESADTAYVYLTGIEPNKQGQGEVGPLMKNLTDELKRQGYSFLERDCVLTQGYADKVGKAYEGAIIEQHDHTRWPEVGPERFSRIDLSKVA